MSWLDQANEDLRLYRLKRVGHKHMIFEQLWREWLERD